jgi:hypothetical protein
MGSGHHQGRGLKALEINALGIDGWLVRPSVVAGSKMRRIKNGLPSSASETLRWLVFGRAEQPCMMAAFSLVMVCGQWRALGLDDERSFGPASSCCTGASWLRGAVYCAAHAQQWPGVCVARVPVRWLDYQCAARFTCDSQNPTSSPATHDPIIALSALTTQSFDLPHSVGHAFTPLSLALQKCAH